MSKLKSIEGWFAGRLFDSEIILLRVLVSALQAQLARSGREDD
jgi:hypothetical protein